jgi:hypothetical protein
MARFHLRFRDFREETLSATNDLFDAKPWRLTTDDEKAVVAQTWLKAVSEIYEVPEPRIVIGDRIDPPARDSQDALDRWDSAGDPDDPLAYSPGEDDDEGDEDTPEDMNEQIVDERPVLSLDHWSILLLFKRFREYALSAGVDAGANRYEEDDIHGWACSLFYKVRPVMFRARVREGRIGRVSPEDLLTTETLRRMEEERRITEEERVRIEMERDADASFEDIDEDAIARHAEDVERELHDAEHGNDPTDEEEAREFEIEAEEPVIAPSFMEMARRLELHNSAAGEDVQGMNTRPLRRYATSVGIGGVWDMSKDEIIHELKHSESAVSMAQRVITASRSQTGAVR